MTTDPADARELGTREERQLAMLLHFSVFAGLVIPFFGLLAPILLWQLKKEQYPSLDAHAYVVLNWMLSSLVYFLAGFLLTFIVIGVPVLFAVAVACIVFPILGGIKANQGKLWRYPLSIQFFK